MAVNVKLGVIRRRKGHTGENPFISGRAGDLWLESQEGRYWVIEQAPSSNSTISTSFGTLSGAGNFSNNTGSSKSESISFVRTSFAANLGYTFKGWYKIDNSGYLEGYGPAGQWTYSVNNSSSGSANVEYYAVIEGVWELEINTGLGNPSSTADFDPNNETNVGGTVSVTSDIQIGQISAGQELTAFSNPNIGIAIPEVTSGQVPVLTLTATPAAGYTFKNWAKIDQHTGMVKGTAYGTQSLQNPYQVTIQDNITDRRNDHPQTNFYAVFEEIPPTTYNVNVASSTGGSVSGGGTYDKSENATLMATPSAGYQFVSWLRGSDSSGSEWYTGSSFTLTGTTVDSDVSFYAVFEETAPVTYNVILANNEGGSVSGGGTYDQNTNVPISATPSTGYQFVRWVQGTDATGTQITTSQTFIQAVNSNVSYYAVFEETNTIDGTVELGVIEWIESDATFTYTDTNPNHSADFRVGDNSDIEIKETLTGIGLNGPQSSSSSWGTLSGFGEYDGSSTITYSYSDTPAGYEFLGWFDRDSFGIITRNNDTNASQFSRTFDPSDASDVARWNYWAISGQNWKVGHYAVIREIPTTTYNVILANNEGGSVSGGGTYDQNTNVPILATPSAGYQFVRWVRGTSSIGTQVATSSSFSHTVTSDVSFYGVFEPIPIEYSLQVSAGAGGSVSGATSGNYEEGTSLTLTATPDSGYIFYNWINAQNVFLSANNPVTITIDSDKVYTAKFILENATSFTAGDLVWHNGVQKQIASISGSIITFQDGTTSGAAGVTLDEPNNTSFRVGQSVWHNGEQKEIASISGTTITFTDGTYTGHASVSASEPLPEGNPVTIRDDVGRHIYDLSNKEIPSAEDLFLLSTVESDNSKVAKYVKFKDMSTALMSDMGQAKNGISTGGFLTQNYPQLIGGEKTFLSDEFLKIQITSGGSGSLINGQVYNISEYVSAIGSSGADLGNHVATQNLKMSDYCITHSGGAQQGIKFSSDGSVGIGFDGSFNWSPSSQYPFTVKSAKGRLGYLAGFVQEKQNLSVLQLKAPVENSSYNFIDGEVGNNLKFKINLKGGATFKDSLTVDKAITGGNGKFVLSEAGDLTLTGSTTTNALEVKENATFSNTATFKKPTTFSGEATFSSTTKFESSATFNNSATFNKSTAFNENLTIADGKQLIVNEIVNDEGSALISDGEISGNALKVNPSGGLEATEAGLQLATSEAALLVILKINQDTGIAYTKGQTHVDRIPSLPTEVEDKFANMTECYSWIRDNVASLRVLVQVIHETDCVEPNYTSYGIRTNANGTPEVQHFSLDIYNTMTQSDYDTGGSGGLPSPTAGHVRIPEDAQLPKVTFNASNTQQYSNRSVLWFEHMVQFRGIHFVCNIGTQQDHFCAIRSRKDDMVFTYCKLTLSSSSFLSRVFDIIDGGTLRFTSDIFHDGFTGHIDIDDPYRRGVDTRAPSLEFDGNGVVGGIGSFLRSGINTKFECTEFRPSSLVDSRYSRLHFSGDGTTKFTESLFHLSKFSSFIFGTPLTVGNDLTLGLTGINAFHTSQYNGISFQSTGGNYPAFPASRAIRSSDVSGSDYILNVNFHASDRTEGPIATTSTFEKVDDYY